MPTTIDPSADPKLLVLLKQRLIPTRTTSWNTTVIPSQLIQVMTTHAKHFSNAGGKITFSASRSSGSPNDQNTDWTNLLSAMGTVKLGYTSVTASSGSNTGSRGFYDLTSSFQEIFIKAGSGSCNSATTINKQNTTVVQQQSFKVPDVPVQVEDTLTPRWNTTTQCRSRKINSGTLPNGYTITVANRNLRRIA